MAVLFRVFVLFCPWLYCVNIKLILKCIIDCTLLVYPIHNLGRDSKKIRVSFSLLILSCFSIFPEAHEFVLCIVNGLV